MRCYPTSRLYRAKLSITEVVRVVSNTLQQVIDHHCIAITRLTSIYPIDHVNKHIRPCTDVFLVDYLAIVVRILIFNSSPRLYMLFFGFTPLSQVIGMIHLIKLKSSAFPVHYDYDVGSIDFPRPVIYVYIKYIHISLYLALAIWPVTILGTLNNNGFANL